MTLTNRILRERDAAAALGISPGSLRWHRRRGTGPAWVRITDRAIGYLVSDLESWIVRHRTGAGDGRTSAQLTPALLESMLTRLAERDPEGFAKLLTRMGLA